MLTALLDQVESAKAERIKADKFKAEGPSEWSPH
jgi:hypothetical protein